MKKIKEIFDVKVFLNDIFLENIKTKKEVIFSTKPEEVSKKRTLCFVDNENSIDVCFNLNDEQAPFFFRFEEMPFSKEELQTFSTLFGFLLEPHKLHPEILTGSLSFFDKAYSNKCYGIIKNYSGLYYIIIFASRRSQLPTGAAEDFYGDDVYYIHGIWQIDSIKELIKVPE